MEGRPDALTFGNNSGLPDSTSPCGHHCSLKRPRAAVLRKGRPAINEVGTPDKPGGPGIQE